MVVVGALDFFSILTRDKYASYVFPIFFLISIVLSIAIRRPIKTISIKFPRDDFSVEVRIGDIFDATGAIMISTNTEFELDVAGGKIARDSLQGQFTACYFTGNQNELITQVRNSIQNLEGNAPFPMGTTITINTHGKTFYFNVMSVLNENGNASTTPENVKEALQGLWTHVREAGELQELAVPLVGTGRGRLSTSRKQMIALIAESFVVASRNGMLSSGLVIAVRPEDASKWGINLYDIKDHLSHVLGL